MRIEIVSWLDSAPEYAEELDAGLRIEIAGKNVTEVVNLDARSSRGTVYLSASRLARWFAINWWRHRYEAESRPPTFGWRFAHEMDSIDGGYIWPPLLFSNDGERISVSRRFISSDSTWLRYVTSFRKSALSVAIFDEAVDDFLDRVRNRAVEVGVSAFGIVETCKALRLERANLQWTDFRRREALLGYDPDDLPTDVEETLTAADHRIGERAVEEIAAFVFSQHHQDNAARAFVDATWTIEVTLPNALTLRPPVVDSRGNALGGETALPHERGYQAARWFRSEVGAGERLDDAGFSNLFGVSRTAAIEPLGIEPDNRFREAARRPPPAFGVGVRRGGELDAVLRQSQPAAQRFEIARLVGDHLFFQSDDPWRPVTALRTPRQRFQRAFAAELLSPIQALRSVAPMITDMIVAAEVGEEFGVSSEVIRYQLVNNGYTDPASDRRDV